MNSKSRKSISKSPNGNNALGRVDLNAQFTELIMKHGKFVRSFIAKKSWNKENVDDIYQITMLEAFKSYKNFRHECHPRTWMCSIAMMVFRGYLRKRVNIQLESLECNDERQVQILDTLEGGLMVNPEKIYEFESLCSSISENVNLLPEDIKSLFLTVVYKGTSYEKAAKIYDIPIGTVRSKIARAREILREKRRIHSS